MTKNISIILGITILAAVSGFYILQSKKSPERIKMKADNIPALTDQQATELGVGTAPHDPTTLTFDVSGGNFYFVPNIIHVKKGDTVKINFTNVGGFHDLKIDEFKVATEIIGVGKEATAEFIADKAGTFEYYCSVGSHRAMGMKGILIVE